MTSRRSGNIRGKHQRFCLGHHTRLPEIRQRISEAKKGRPGAAAEENPAWAGDAVGYAGVHTWVRTRRPLTGACQVCGATDRKTENANLSGEYRRDLDDFLEMCRFCHRQYDRDRA